MSRLSFLSIVVISAVVLATTPAAFADEPSVTAVLDSSEAMVGQPVQLQIKVTGARSATMPEQIGVDGLDIRYSGESQSFEMQNFQTSYSVIYSYTIMPERAGTFRIPPQILRVAGKSLKTPELTLNVANGRGGGSARSGRAAPAVDPAKNAFLELVVAKTTAYVGEMIPAEIRLGFNTRTPAESLANGIDLTGQGFTTQKMRDPRQAIETVHGRSYQTFTFKTAISPVRAGKIDVGPIEAHPVVRVPQVNRNRPSIRDPFGLNDPFFDNFFNDPAFAPSMPRQINLKSEAATLEVKPLPPNAPPSFSGAVGNFSLTAEARPTTAKIGDPITVTVKISGRGNFDRVSAPVFENDSGWHKYPPSSQFVADDDVGISGTKTFETVLSANEAKDQLPTATFTYFDPLKEQYVTLRSDALHVRIEGGAPPPRATPAATATAARPAASPPTPAKQQDILYQLNELPARTEAFAPVWQRPAFWIAQVVPLLGLVGYFLWQWRKARRNNREARRLAALQHEAAQLQRDLQRPDASPREYLAGASRAVQLKAAAKTNIPAHAVDADVAANVFGVDEMTRNRLRELFARSDELRYSGGGNGSTAVSPEQRQEVLELLQQLR